MSAMVFDGLMIPCDLEPIDLHWFVRPNARFATRDRHLPLRSGDLWNVRQQYPPTLACPDDDAVALGVELFLTLDFLEERPETSTEMSIASMSASVTGGNRGSAVAAPTAFWMISWIRLGCVAT